MSSRNSNPRSPNLDFSHDHDHGHIQDNLNNWELSEIANLKGGAQRVEKDKSQIGGDQVPRNLNLLLFYSGFCLQGFGQAVQQAVDDERESELVAKRENEENEVCLEPCKPFLLRCLFSSDVSLAFA